MRALPLPTTMDSGTYRRMGDVRTLPVQRNDCDVVAGLKASEGWARAALFDRYARDVQRVLARILGNDSELQDLVQDVFLRAFEACDRIESPERLRSWVVAISVFTAKERIRRKKRKWWMVLIPGQELEVVADADGACEPGGSDHQQLLAATYRVMEKLPDDERIALSLRMIDGMELEELAGVTGVSLSTAKRRIARAQEQFRILAAHEPHLVEWHERGGT